MTINWYPGHMVKARREIKENLKLVDVVTIVVDARAPQACRNPELEALVQHRQMIYILNKADLADETALAISLRLGQTQGLKAVAVDSLAGRGIAETRQLLQAAFAATKADLLRRGRRVRPIRVMVVGVPNVGKSTFLNKLAGKNIAVTGAKPGVTRGRQWVRWREDIELMDTPGMMWPRIDSEEQGLKLALLDIIGERAYEEEDVARYLLGRLRESYPEIFQHRFQLTDLPADDTDLLEAIAFRLGHLRKGNQADTEKTCKTLLHDFRRGKLGKISLEP